MPTAPAVNRRFVADSIPTRYDRPLQPPVELLGEWLVRRGVINRTGLFLALDAAYRHDCRLGDAAVWLGLVSRERIELEAARFARFANHE